LKRFNGFSQAVLLVVCSGLFAFGQATATKASNNNAGSSERQGQTSYKHTPATGKLTGQQFNALVAQEASQNVVTSLATQLGGPLSGTWSGTVTETSWNLTFSGSINSQAAAFTESGSLKGQVGSWKDSGTVGDNKVVGSGTAKRINNNEVSWDQSVKGSIGRPCCPPATQWIQYMGNIAVFGSNLPARSDSFDGPGSFKPIFDGTQLNLETGVIFGSSVQQEAPQFTTIQEGSISYTNGAISYSSASYAPPNEDCSSGNKVPIYSNLGPSNDAFDYTDGYLISGSGSPYGSQQWVGFPFTPTENHTATEIDAAGFYYGNDGQAGNDFNFGIWSDSSGAPGTELNGADVANLPTWTGTSGDCCNTQHATIAPTALTAGTQYWVVLSTDSNGTNSLGVWDYVYNDANGTLAYNQGSGWSTEQAPASAFAVCGTS
jgi:hypothetical protein